MAFVEVTTKGVASRSAAETGNFDQPLQYETVQTPLGTAAHSWVEFQPDPYTNNEGNRVEPPSIRLLEVIVTARNVKNMVITPVRGQPGTVKELFSEGDYNINLSGKFVDRADYRIREQMRDFKEVFQVPERIRIECPFLEDLGVSDIVIRDWQASQIRGSQSMVDLSVEMLSDTPVELRL